MFLKRSWKGVLLNGLVIVLLLSLPLIAAAQTTGTSGATAAMTNGITSPKDMAALSGTVEVRGYASGADFMKWQLDLLPNNNPNAAIFLALGETAGEFTYSLDTSKLPAGEHSLRLRVVRNDSNYDEYLTKFTIGGATSGGAATTAATPTATSAVTTTATMTATTPAATPAPAATSGASATSGAGVTSNGLATPREGQNVSGEFVVRGYASDPDFMKWQLDLLPGGNANQAAFLSFGESTGVFTYTLNAANLPAGQHALRLRVVRNDSNYSEYTTNFTIGGATSGSATASGNATGVGSTSAVTSTTTSSTASASGATTATATTNGISAPKDGATVSGPLQITGYASSPDFMKWQLDLLVGGSENQAGFLAFGETAGAVSYTLDTTMLPAGEHALRLRVVRSDSNYDEYVVKFTLTK